MFLGANDGFPMRGRRCCGKRWSREYARRVGKTMDAYLTGGAACVLAPAAAGPGGLLPASAYPAVNRGIRLATRRRRTTVDTVALNKFFTPRGRYRDVMRYRGRNVRVRQRDGIHLSSAGASIAARLVARRIRRDRVLR